MRYSDRSDGFNCPACGKATQFGPDSAKLEHVDGSPLCVWNAAELPPIGIAAPVDESDVPDYLLASAQRSQERAARLEVAHSRHSELEPYGTGKRGGIGWGTVAFFLVLALMVTGCFWFVIANWPQP